MKVPDFFRRTFKKEINRRHLHSITRIKADILFFAWRVAEDITE